MVAMLVAFALVLPPVGSSVVNLDDLTPAPLGDFDSRDAVQPSAAQLAAANALGAKVEWNTLGAPASVIKYGGYLATSLTAPDATTAARQWLDANATLFGLGSTSSLTLWSSAPLTGSSVYAVTFRQSAGGITSSDGVVTVAVVPSARSGWDVVYASSTLAPDQSPTGSYAITPAAAYAQAASATGTVVSALEVQPAGDEGRNDHARRRRQPRHGDHREDAVRDPARGSARRYETTIVSDDGGSISGYDVVVDAETGSLLYRQNVVNNVAGDPTWNAFPIAPQTTPNNSFPWGYPSNDTRQFWCWTTAEHVHVPGARHGRRLSARRRLEVPVGRHPELGAGADHGTTQTTGNNVDDVRLWCGQPQHVRHRAPRRRARPATTATRSRTPGTRRAATRRSCRARATTSTPRSRTCSRCTTACTTSRTTSASTRAHWNAQQYNNGVTTVDPSPPPGGPVVGRRQRRRARQRAGGRAHRLAATTRT